MPTALPKSNSKPQGVAQLREDVNILAQEVQDIKNTLSGLDGLKDDLREFEKTVSTFKALMDGVNPVTLSEQVERVILILDGDPTKDVIGVRTRVRTIEGEVGKITDERNAIKWMLVGLGLTSITNLGAILTLISKATGAG
jgi:hypothetical protein